MKKRSHSLSPRSAAVLAAVALLVLAFAPAQYLGRQQDDLLNLIAAKALLAGRYCLFTSPGCPPLTNVVPGLPIALAPLAAFTERPGVFQAFAALLLAACPIALWAWLRRRCDETTALLAACLFAANPLVLSQSGTLMPEAAYLLVFLGLLAAAEKGRATATGLWAAPLLLIRPAGLSALPATAIPFLRARRWRDTARALWPPLLAASLWCAWSWSKSGIEEAGELSATYSGHSLMKPLVLAAANARFYCAEWGASFLPPALAGGRLALVLGLALAAAAAYGLVRALRRRPDDPAAWALLGAAFMHAFWAWQYERYLIPLLPLLLWALSMSLGKAAKPAFATLLVLQLGAQTLPRLGRVSPWAKPELSRSYAWIAAQPRPGILSSAFYVRDGYLTRLPSLPLPDDVTAEAFAAHLKQARVSCVLRVDELDIGLNADPSSSWRISLERAHRYLDDPLLFRKIHEEPSEHAAVYAPL